MVIETFIYVHQSSFASKRVTKKKKKEQRPKFTSLPVHFKPFIRFKVWLGKFTSRIVNCNTKPTKMLLPD